MAGMMHLQKTGTRACSPSLSSLILYGTGRYNGQSPPYILNARACLRALFLTSARPAQAFQ
jgi:hypothetical protein